MTDAQHVLPTVSPTQFQNAFGTIADNIETVVRGKRNVVEQTLLCLLSGGHLLVEDVPGVGKTTLAKALAGSIATEVGRIQFTPDLLPADVTGVSIWNRTTSTFEFRKGPIFSRLLVADEINRASPKTQSALLEAMAESQVTIDGETHALPEPFMVIATQNPIEQEGTYPLPESQLDRFLMRISVGYPSRDDEMAILQTHEADGVVADIKPVASVDDIMMLRAFVSQVAISPELRSYLIDIAGATRAHSAISLGMSPRATLSLQRASRAYAAAAGRDFVKADDVKVMAPVVVNHRLALRPDALLSGRSATAALSEVLASVPVP